MKLVASALPADLPAAAINSGHRHGTDTAPAESLQEKEHELVDFGAADFGPVWQAQQLARGPPKTLEELKALREEIALLESAMELCDAIPCIGIQFGPASELQAQQQEQAGMVATAGGSPSQAFDGKQVGGRKHARKLSELASQQQHQHQNDEQHFMEDVLALETQTVNEEQQENNELSMPIEMRREEQLPSKPPGESNLAQACRQDSLTTTVAISAPLGASPSRIENIEQNRQLSETDRPSPKRRRVERQMAAAEAAADQALRAHRPILQQQRPKQKEQEAPLHAEEQDHQEQPPGSKRIEQRRRPPKAAVGVGTSLCVIWKKGRRKEEFYGVVTAVDESSGQHKIAYCDGEIAWQDLDDEEWWVADRIPAPTSGAGGHHADAAGEEDNGGEEGRRPSGGKSRSGSGWGSGDNEEDGKASPPGGQSFYVVPDSQGIEGPSFLDINQHQHQQQGNDSPATRMLSGSFGTQSAAAALGALGNGFVMASQLPLNTQEDPSQEAAAALEALPEPANHLSQPFSLNFPAPAPAPAAAPPGLAPASAGFGASPAPPLDGRSGPFSALASGPSSIFFRQNNSTGAGSMPSRSHRPSNGSRGSGSAKQDVDIRTLILSQQAAAAANESRPIRLALNLSEFDALVPTLNALTEILPSFQFSGRVDAETTHVVVETDAFTISKKRSRYYLEGVVLGCWVVSEKWLEACLNAGKRVSETIFEVRGCPLPKRSATNDGYLQEFQSWVPKKGRDLRARGQKVFQGQTVFVGSFEVGSTQQKEEKKGKDKHEKSRELMLSLLTLGGATLLEKPAALEGKTVVVVGLSNAHNKKQAEGFRLRKLNIVVVNIMWVLDSQSFNLKGIMMAFRVKINASGAISHRVLVSQPANRRVITPLRSVFQLGRSFPKTRASGKDFDAILMDVANKFEKSDNKAAIVGWSLAAFGAITTAEWFIHLPLFDFLLGGPIQFLGLLTAANYGLQFYKGNKIDPLDEIEGLVNKVAKELPGLGK